MVYDPDRFRKRFISGQPTSMQMLAGDRSTEGIDRFMNRNEFGQSPTAAGSSPLGLTRQQGITQSQNMGITDPNSIVSSMQRQEEAQGMQAQLEQATENKAREFGTREMVGDVMGGLTLGASLASMMMSKDRDFGAKTKRFFGEAMASPLTEKYVSRGIDAIIGGIGGEAAEGMAKDVPWMEPRGVAEAGMGKSLGIGEGPLEAAGDTTQETFSEAGQEIAEEIAGETVGGATGEVAAEAAGEAARETAGKAVEATTEAAASAGETAAASVPILGGIAKAVSGVASGEGAGKAIAKATTGTIAGALASAIPYVGWALAPAVAAGTSELTGMTMRDVGKGGPGMGSSLAAKTMKTPSAKELLKGEYGYG